MMIDTFVQIPGPARNAEKHASYTNIPTFRFHKPASYNTELRIVTVVIKLVVTFRNILYILPDGSFYWIVLDRNERVIDFDNSLKTTCIFVEFGGKGVPSQTRNSVTTHRSVRKID